MFRQTSNCDLQELESRVAPSTTPPLLVRDINDQPERQGSRPNNFVEVGSTTYFLANTPEFGVEIWKTDGSSGGTKLVRDLLPGFKSPQISSMTNYNGVLYFSGCDGTRTGLWKSDGTSLGTVLVTPLSSNGYALAPRNIQLFNGMMFFSTREFNQPSLLWKSDGTSAGTIVVRQFSSIETNASIRNIVYNSALYFYANDGITGSELWRTDGTSAGTQLVADVNPGIGNSFASFSSFFTLSGSELYFVANGGASGVELWKTDGSTGGTNLVYDITPGSESTTFSTLVSTGGKVYFTARPVSQGYELWCSDGTSAGTLMLKTYQFPPNQSSSASLGEAGGIVYFASFDTAIGAELWRTDGTTAGTVLVRDIYPGAGRSDPWLFANVGGKLYFDANDGVTGVELWTSDGTSSGTVIVKDINPGPAQSRPVVSPTPTGSQFYMMAGDNLHGYELWRSDGTSTGTQLVRDIRTGTGGSYTGRSVNVNGTLFFTGGDGVHNTSLLKSDGTSNGTTFISESIPRSVRYLVNMNGVLYFSASDGMSSGNLWRSDGTSSGSYALTNANVSPRYLHNANGTLYFVGLDPTHGLELWVSNGTSTGTRFVKDIYPGKSHSFPRGFTVAGDLVYFLANDGVHGEELWRSDGTLDGTFLTRDIRVGSANGVSSNGVGSSLAEVAANLNGIAYFAATDGVNGTELWRSDGTSTGTYIVRNIALGSASSSPRALTAFNGLLYFTTSTGLWKSDGTSTGTVLVNNLVSGTAITTIGDSLFISGSGIWKSDGSSAGTSRISNLSSSSPTRVGGALYFTTSDPVTGLWAMGRSDGTSAGTTRLDFNEQKITDTVFPTGVNDKVYFRANGDGIGTEFYSITERPSIVSITSSSSNGTFFTGQTVHLTLRFNRPVTLAGGDLILSLNSGATAIVNVNPFGGLTASATYVVQAGQSSPALNIVGLSLTGGATLADDAGNDVSLSLPADNLSVNRTIIVNPLPPTTVAFVIVNLGMTQRSRLTSLILEFSQSVDVSLLTGPGAIVLTRTSGPLAGTIVKTGAVAANGRINLLPQTGTVYSMTLTFANADGAAVTSGVEHGSLADGSWQLTIPYLQYISSPNAIRRLFGDSDANGTVDGSDATIFGNAFKTSDTSFDFNNDGIVDGTDLAQFGNRFGMSI